MDQQAELNQLVSNMEDFRRRISGFNAQFVERLDRYSVEQAKTTTAGHTGQSTPQQASIQNQIGTVMNGLNEEICRYEALIGRLSKIM